MKLVGSLLAALGTGLCLATASVAQTPAPKRGRPAKRR